ncbi:MAG: deoxyribose-phosphate aldolase [Pseudomonadota bacterium]|nr:deoxyribose-phosphate aldolase [Pseudomonadota bacterium]
MLQPELQILQCIDLTSLNDADTDASITALCSKAHTAHGDVAGVCTYQRFVPLTKKLLAATHVRIATVSNFPHGGDDIAATCDDISASIANGADEIDVVMPWQRLVAGDDVFVGQFLGRCRQACGDHITLKVILETGALPSGEHIRRASQIAIDQGANFIKTSTGKVDVGATLAAAEIMLETIKRSDADCGFKASGGIKTTPIALSYLNLCATIMGPNWISPQHFRVGASSLLDELLLEMTATQME